MVFDINVLGILMEHLIFSKIYSTLIVTKQVNARIFLESSVYKPFNQADSLQASAIAMYSASVVD
jgi:hypothetical protein